eukprot:4082530-Pleurochrysis_carterae.AAC.2
MSVGRALGRLRCPGGKRELILAAMSEMRGELEREGRLHWQQACSIVGKLANLAQVLPELKLVLRGGYAVTRPAGGGTGKGWWRWSEWLRLRKGGRAAQDWKLLLDVATSILEDNKGVPLAPRSAFAEPDREGSMVVTTDASGVSDGVGGYSFAPECGTQVTWLVSEKWPTEVQQALARGAATALERAAELARM